MDFITVDGGNIEKEHICCCIADKKGESCVSSKKAWMKETFDQGLVFRRSDTRGKVFIEYIPAEKAWYPVDGEGYMHINCFWVSGQYKGQGHANELLSYCIEDAKAKGKRGISVISSDKKRPFLSDPSYLKYKGFQIADQALPFFVLYYLPFAEGESIPKFRDCARQGKTEEKGLVLYYSNQCPHTDKYVPLLQAAAQRRGQEISVHKMERAEQAQNAPTPIPTYSLFFDGTFVTNEIFSEKKFEKFLVDKGL